MLRDGRQQARKHPRHGVLRRMQARHALQTGVCMDAHANAHAVACPDACVHLMRVCACACTRACVCWCKCACRHWHATHSPSAQDPAHKLLDVLVSPGLVDVMQNEDNLIFQGMTFFQMEVAYFCCGFLAPMLPKSATRTT